MSPQKFGFVAQRITEYVFSELQFLNRLATLPDKYMAVFSNWVNPPLQVWNRWKEDKEVCNQLLNGVSPMDITVVKDINVVPVEMRQLKGQGKSLQELIDSKRLFIVDHQILTRYPQKPPKLFYAPVLLVYKELPSEELTILGIMITRNAAGTNKIYTPDSATPFRYLFAKIIFQNADNQIHQFKWHLGLTHLGMEPIAIATYNTIYQKKHPIGLLLNPHFKDTIGINYMARQTLVAEVGAFTDQTFSIGTANALSLFNDVWKTYTFKSYSFPEQLKARGFDEGCTDGLKNYYYRDDGYLIWNAIKGYAKSVVDITYKSDADVVDDSILQEWANECADPKLANFPGFPKITGKDILVEALTTIIFNCSAQHSAINYSQYDYISYVPQRPDSLFAPMPEGDADITWEDIQKALPNMIITQFQVLFAYLLTLPQFTTLLTLPDTQTVFPEQHKQAVAILQEIQNKIKTRNDTLTASKKVPYPFLQPDRIATSIAI